MGSWGIYWPGSPLNLGATMPRAIAVPLREAILRRSRQQQDALTIARELDLSVRTVRHLLQRFRLRSRA